MRERTPQTPKQRKADWLVFAIFFVGDIGLMFSIGAMSRTFRADVLAVYAALFGLLIAVPAGILAMRRVPYADTANKVSAGVLVGIGIVSGSFALAFDSNVRYKRDGYVTESMPVIEKTSHHGKSGWSFDLIVDEQGHRESLAVRHNEWNAISVGQSYSAKVFTGLWGFRFVDPAWKRQT